MTQGKLKAVKQKKNKQVKKQIERKWSRLSLPEPGKVDLGAMDKSDQIAVKVRKQISAKTTRGLERHIVEKMRLVQDKMYLKH